MLCRTKRRERIILGQTERIAATAAKCKRMELLNFLNNNLYNWEEILSRAPYFLKISYDGPYVMLKYQQFASDMSLSICQQARGAIFRLNKNKTAYIPVSIAMYKFSATYTFFHFHIFH